MNKNYDQELIDLLSQIATRESMSNILDNLLTPQEREELGLRLQIFKSLIEGDSQRDIAKRLNVSLATVSRGSKELQYGKPGIKRALARD